MGGLQASICLTMSAAMAYFGGIFSNCAAVALIRPSGDQHDVLEALYRIAVV